MSRRRPLVGTKSIASLALRFRFPSFIMLEFVGFGARMAYAASGTACEEKRSRVDQTSSQGTSVDIQWGPSQGGRAAVGYGKLHPCKLDVALSQMASIRGTPRLGEPGWLVCLHPFMCSQVHNGQTRCSPPPPHHRRRRRHRHHHHHHQTTSSTKRHAQNQNQGPEPAG